MSICSESSIIVIASEAEASPPSKTKELSCSESQWTTWENDFLIHKNGDVFQCLVCCNTFKHYTESIFKQHYNIFHSCDFGRYEGIARRNQIQELIIDIAMWEMIQSFPDQDKALLEASYKICLQMAEEGRACVDGNFVKNSIMSTSLLFHSNQYVNIFSKLDLSPTAVVRRTFELSSNVKKQLRNRKKKIITYSLALQVSQFEDGTYLAFFVRGVRSNLQVLEYFLQIIPINATTTSNDIFYALSEVINDSGLPWKNLFSISVSPKIVQDRSDLVTIIKEGVRKQRAKNNIIDLTHMWDLEIVCPKTKKLQYVMLSVIRTLCLMRAGGSNRREFSTFLTDLERNHFDDIPRNALDYWEMNWLKISELLKGFLSLTQEVKKFLIMEGGGHKLDNILWILDCAFLCDLMEHLHNVNTSLRDTNQPITHFLEKIAAFKLKISLWIEQLKCKNFCHFTAIESIIRKESVEKQTINIDFFVEVFKELQNDLEAYISIDKNLKKKLEIFETPFKVDPITTDVFYQLELIDLQSDMAMLAKYEKHTNDLSGFYKDLPKKTYPQIYNLATQILSMFSSTSIFEQFSSCLKRCEKGSPMISNMHLNSMLRIMTSPTITPNINSMLLKEPKQ